MNPTYPLLANELKKLAGKLPYSGKYCLRPNDPYYRQWLEGKYGMTIEQLKLLNAEPNSVTPSQEQRAVTQRYGTSHFISREAAEKYYTPYGYDDVKKTVERKLAEGEIHIGEPAPREGWRVSIIPDEGRYEMIEGAPVMTREEHMAPYTRDDWRAEMAERHRRYYGQFVTASTRAFVAHCIGIDKLLASRDPHFNDIPLKQWDNLVTSLPLAKRFEAVGDYYTLASGVCVAKEAARQIVEREQAKQSEA
jgi:hypothetical protein